MDNDARFHRYYEEVEKALPGYLPQGLTDQKTIVSAMAYSLLGAGKRIRAVMTLAFCEKCGGSIADAVPFACAVEMVHAYSLVHDDLPCMDDDDLRRGKPSCHIAFGEAMAVLAGDALLTQAFSVLASADLPPARIARAVAELSGAAGASGMVGGQVMDIENVDRPLSEAALRKLHSLKTGAMIRAAARLGCVAAGADAALTEAADRYASAVGLAFQIVDDVLDATSTAEELGKNVGMDAGVKKTTFVTLFGAEDSRRKAQELAEEAERALRGTPLEDSFFSYLADRLAMRRR